jgi:hypothetical protein
MSTRGRRAVASSGAAERRRLAIACRRGEIRRRLPCSALIDADDVAVEEFGERGSTREQHMSASARDSRIGASRAHDGELD